MKNSFLEQIVLFKNALRYPHDFSYLSQFFGDFNTVTYRVSDSFPKTPFFALFYIRALMLYGHFERLSALFLLDMLWVAHLTSANHL